jgi:hypothetical protein
MEKPLLTIYRVIVFGLIGNSRSSIFGTHTETHNPDFSELDRRIFIFYFPKLDF